MNWVDFYRFDTQHLLFMLLGLQNGSNLTLSLECAHLVNQGLKLWSSMPKVNDTILIE